MYTMSKIEKRTSRNKIGFSPIIAFFIAITLITSAVKFTINFKQLYYFDINLLKITEDSKFSKEEIIKNYDVLIDYLKPSNKGDLKFPTFPMSAEAKQHFVEVKNIFIMLEYLMYISLVIALIGIIACIIKNNNKFLKWTSIFLLVLPIAPAIPFAINFDATFTAFHKIFFRNDYWLFDPKTDPIITVLPQPFFMHAAIMILMIISIESTLSFWLFKKLKKKRYSYNNI
jgi:integral membrane protein (TIGR01906 family)